MPSPSISLISVNKTPARAALLVSQLLERLRPDYDIAHVANSSTIEELNVVLGALVQAPSILICSSQWIVPEQEIANKAARKLFPEIKIINIPSDLDAREGGQAIVGFLETAVRESEIPILEALNRKRERYE